MLVVLVFYELVINVVKYGVLLVDKGEVCIMIYCDVDVVEIEWVECGGLIVGVVLDWQGFGMCLIDMSVVQQFGGILLCEWLFEGLKVMMWVQVNWLVWNQFDYIVGLDVIWVKVVFL